MDIDLMEMSHNFIYYNDNALVYQEQTGALSATILE